MLKGASASSPSGARRGGTIPGTTPCLTPGYPFFHSCCAAVRGIRALVDLSAFVLGYRSPFASLPLGPARSAAPARKLLAAGGSRNEVEAKAMLSLCGISTVPEHVARSAREAVTAATRLGTPVVIKALAARIAHKSSAWSRSE